MFEKYDVHARRIIVLAQEQAREHRHSYIGTEHLLLGFIDHDQGRDGQRVLQNLGADPEAVRSDVDAIIGVGDADVPGHIPFTPRVKKVLEMPTGRKFRKLGGSVTPAMLLLALVEEGDGVAAQVLEKAGVRPLAIRAVLPEKQVGGPGDGARGSRDTAPAAAPVLRRKAALEEEARQLRSEVRRLRALLVRHGIDPDSPDDAVPVA